MHWCCRDGVFPLFDLPPEAVELVYAGVAAKEDKNSLRLVSKASRALVDRCVTAVLPGSYWRGGIRVSDVSTLAAAPWHRLQTLVLSGPSTLGLAGAEILAGARRPNLRSLQLQRAQLGDEGVLALTKADWKELQSLRLRGNRLGPCGAAALAAAARPTGETLSTCTWISTRSGLLEQQPCREPSFQTSKF